MATITTTFTATGNSQEMLLKPGDFLTYSGSGTYAATFHVEYSNNAGASWNIIVSNSTANATVTDTVRNDTGSAINYRFRCSAFTSGSLATTLVESTGEILYEVKDKSGNTVFAVTEAGIQVTGSQTISGTQTFTGSSTFAGTVSVLDTFTIGGTTDPTKKVRFEPDGLTTATTRVVTVPDANITLASTDTAQSITALKTFTANLAVTAPATDAVIGAVAAPASGTTAVTIARIGNFFYLTFTLTTARIAVTDGAASGSHGATKLFDFAEQGVVFLGCRQNYTAYVADGTGVPADDAFVIGVGTTAISAAADGVLAAAEQNIGASLAQTLVAGTTTGTKFTGSAAAVDGTGTALDIYLNFSGDAATTDGNGTIDVTGSITVVGCFLGDD
jgi:hypothetical protein